jgi:hypothetical protein
MLLNEFLKEHRKMEEQSATIAELKKELQRQPRISKSRFKDLLRACRK